LARSCGLENMWEPPPPPRGWRGTMNALYRVLPPSSSPTGAHYLLDIVCSVRRVEPSTRHKGTGHLSLRRLRCSPTSASFVRRTVRRCQTHSVRDAHSPQAGRASHTLRLQPRGSARCQSRGLLSPGVSRAVRGRREYRKAFSIESFKWTSTDGLARMTKLLDLVFGTLPVSTVILSGVTHINATLCAQCSKAPWHPPSCPVSMPTNIVTCDDQMINVVQGMHQRGRDVYFHDPNCNRTDAHACTDGDRSTWSDGHYNTSRTAYTSRRVVSQR
jgi:hypothetical protein